MRGGREPRSGGAVSRFPGIGRGDVRAMTTERYRRRRDLDRTPEPGGDTSRRDAPFFVVQEHAARSHHFDFRLACDGVLKSWAVPKGPSTDPREKRLAIRVEDHPLDYAGFEGVIPEGQYGAGSVIVWDTGPYENITEKEDGLRPLGEALDSGHALVRLQGKKLRGGYALQRIDSDKDQWLLIKMDDDEADARRRPVSTEPRSVLTDRTVAEVGEAES